MSNKTLKELIQWTQEFHREMALYLGRSAERATDERVRLLLGYLVEHEENLEQLVGRHLEKASDTALNTWVSDYMERYHPSEHDNRNQPYHQMSTQEIMNEIQQQHNRILEIYDHMGDFVQRSAEDVVKQIIDLEEQEILRIAQSANRLEDL